VGKPSYIDIAAIVRMPCPKYATLATAPKPTVGNLRDYEMPRFSGFPKHDERTN
jgi:hypothetical protein